MADTTHSFEGSDGRQLSGVYHPPEGLERGLALFAHCFTCTKEIRAARVISDTLGAAGFGTLRFDFAGLGESEGDFGETHFSSNVEDLVAAANWLGNHKAAPTLLVGHSLGGAAVLAAASHIASVKAVATLGAPYAPSHVTHLFDDQLETLAARGEATLRLGGAAPLRITQALVEDLERYGCPAYLNRLKQALLIMHSPLDAVVGIDNARRIFEHARHPKSFVTLHDTDHLLSKPARARYAAKLIAAWAEAYV